MDLTKTTAADYLKARDIVADEVKKHTNVQPNTRREISEALLSKGWLDVESILDSVKAPVVQKVDLHPGAPAGAR